MAEVFVESCSTPSLIASCGCKARDRVSGKLLLRCSSPSWRHTTRRRREAGQRCSRHIWKNKLSGTSAYPVICAVWTSTDISSEDTRAHPVYPLLACSLGFHVVTSNVEPIVLVVIHVLPITCTAERSPVLSDGIRTKKRSAQATRINSRPIALKEQNRIRLLFDLLVILSWRGAAKRFRQPLNALAEIGTVIEERNLLLEQKMSGRFFPPPCRGALRLLLERWRGDYDKNDVVDSGSWKRNSVVALTVNIEGNEVNNGLSRRRGVFYDAIQSRS